MVKAFSVHAQGRKKALSENIKSYENQKTTDQLAKATARRGNRKEKVIFEVVKSDSIRTNDSYSNLVSRLGFLSISKLMTRHREHR